MFPRIKQFINALNPRLNATHLKIIDSYLSQREQDLFFSMDKVDQRHCADVAITCLALVQEGPVRVNCDLLIKAALLHDVGKRAGDLQLWERVWIVLLASFWPALLRRLGQKPSGAYYIALNHAAIGAQRCHRASCSPELVRLVALHQAGGSGAELNLLVAADKMN